MAASRISDITFDFVHLQRHGSQINFRKAGSTEILWKTPPPNLHYLCRTVRSAALPARPTLPESASLVKLNIWSRFILSSTWIALLAFVRCNVVNRYWPRSSTPAPTMNGSISGPCMRCNRLCSRTKRTMLTDIRTTARTMATATAMIALGKSRNKSQKPTSPKKIAHEKWARQHASDIQATDFTKTDNVPAWILTARRQKALSHSTHVKV